MSSPSPAELVAEHPIGSQTRTNVLLLSIASSLHELTEALPSLVSPSARAQSIREALAGTGWVTEAPAAEEAPDDAPVAPVTPLPPTKAARSKKKATEAEGA